MLDPVPQPPTLPFLGNITDIDLDNLLVSATHLAKKYGPIFKLSIFGDERYIVSSVELINEVCDEKRFCKSVFGPVKELRNAVSDGLFTAFHGEHNWEVAHRTLVPAFGPLKIQDSFDEMYDIATQLVAKWARTTSERIHVTDDFTRLTLDSIALCAMDKRFNSFYSENMHPFVDAMSRFLIESGRRIRRSRLESLVYRRPQRLYEEDAATMRAVAAEVMETRRANPSDKKDLLNALLFGKDPKTGERMTDESIMNNMITFLVAGHETTSGLLSFTFYFLLKNPDTLQKAQDEVDIVVGKGPVTVHHMSKLPYLEAVLRESLRLQPTAPGFAVESLSADSPGEIIGGRYLIPPKAPIMCLLPVAGRDPTVFGADAEEFKPERMYGENFTKLPPNAWKPFGNGARGCIGRPFAWQESLLTLALILQNFNLRLDDPSYQLQIKQTLTIKPAEFYMRATLRDGIDPVHLERKMHAGLEARTSKPVATDTIATSLPSGKPMTILYGSNSGTCEGLAQTLAGAASSHGFAAKAKPMDSAAGKFPVDQPVIIITASYEGNPPDNAGIFVEWLKNLNGSKLADTRYAVFGCGHHDWVATFQKVPKLIDEEMAAKGASRIAARGFSDVANGTIFDDFDSWQDDHLWPALSDLTPEVEATIEELDLEISTTARASRLRHYVQDGLVLNNILLSPAGAGAFEKRHTELKLPTNLTYEAGDYLAILPLNNPQTISRVLRRFNLPWDAMMTLKRGAHTTIPTGKEVSISSVLAAYVELNSSATRKNIATIAKYATAEDAKQKFAADSTGARIPSVLDMLEARPEIQLPFGTFLSMLTPIRIRQYSISSSPLNDPTVATITYTVHEDPDGRLGVATNYLKSLQSGSIIQLAIKKSHTSFRLPLSNATPVVMVCAGTGLAPFRGFVQERAAKIAASKSDDYGEAVLFIGCRGPEQDKLYAEEFAEWEKMGAVKIFYAFSRATEHSEGCKYVQDRLWHERATVSRLYDSGAQVYICGSSAMGKGVADVFARIAVEKAKQDGKELTHEEGLKWWDALRGERYAVDVFD